MSLAKHDASTGQAGPLIEELAAEVGSDQGRKLLEAYIKAPGPEALLEKARDLVERMVKASEAQAS